MMGETGERGTLYGSGALWRRWGTWRWSAYTCRGPEAGYYPVDQGKGWAFTKVSAWRKQSLWLATHGASPFPACGHSDSSKEVPDAHV